MRKNCPEVVSLVAEDEDGLVGHILFSPAEILSMGTRVKGMGLAPMVVAELFQMLDRVRREEAVSLLIVEQNAELALSVTDHAYLLETGTIVKSGPSAAIREDEAVRRSYLGY